MAKKSRNEIAVGIITLVVLVLTIYIVMMLADWSSLFTAQQKITVRLPYKVGLKGLSEGSPVSIGGVGVGYVTSTRIKKVDPAAADANDVYVFFTMKIPRKYQLRTDCVLLPQNNLLGGEANLSIEDLGSEGEIITGHEPVDLYLADSVIDAIKREFDPDDPDSFFAQVFKRDIPAITEQIQQTIAKANSALDTAEEALRNLKELGGDERVDRIIGNISEVSTNLKLTSREVRRAPWKLLYKPSEKEAKVQAIVDSAGAFAAGAERLDSTSMRLQRLVEAPDEKLDRERIEQVLSELQTSFQQFQSAEQKFWDELR
jgi:hypothetical protein